MCVHICVVSANAFPYWPGCLLTPPVWCGIAYCLWNREMATIDQIIAESNARFRSEGSGLEWMKFGSAYVRELNTRIGGDTRVLVLVWSPERPAYEAANPHRRPVSTECPPREFATHEQVAQWNIQRQVAAMQKALTDAPAGQTMTSTQQEAVFAAYAQPMPMSTAGQPLVVAAARAPTRSLASTPTDETMEPGEPGAPLRSSYAPSGSTGGVRHFCRKCGEPRIDEEDRFCHACGKEM
jgi:hypothetical protein